MRRALLIILKLLSLMIVIAIVTVLVLLFFDMGKPWSFISAILIIPLIASIMNIKKMLFSLFMTIIICMILLIFIFIFSGGIILIMNYLFTGNPWPLIVVMAIVIIPAIISDINKSRRREYIKRYVFSSSIVQRVKNKHSYLSDSEVANVFEALRDFFYIRNEESDIVSMPSVVVDDAWHEFILFTSAYNEFCQHAFGQFLHHTPAEAMQSPDDIQEGIRRAWRLACAKESISPIKPSHLPRLFALDAELGIAEGFVYSMNCQPGDGHYCVKHIRCGVEKKGGCIATCG